MSLRDWKHQVADALRGQRVRGNAACFGVDGMSRRERVGERRRCLRLDPDDFDPASVPGGDAADQAASADGNQQGIDSRVLLFELQSNGSLAEQRLGLIVRMNAKRS